MKNPSLVVTTIIVLSTAIGASLATFYGSQLRQASLTSPAEPRSASSPVTSLQSPDETIPQASPSSSPAVSPAGSPIPALDDFPHRRITLTDEVEPGSDFDRFRSQLRQAVSDRDANFVRRLIPEDGVGFGFGVPQSIETLELQNSDARIWRILEKALAPGCVETPANHYPNTDAIAGVWICSNVTDAFNQQYPPPEDAEGVSYQIENVIVAGTTVNVRSQANGNSPVIGILSNEVVKFDQDTWDAMSPDERIRQVEEPNGWTPIVLPNGKRGFVSERYAYSPLSYRVVFGKVNGQWQILQVPGGD